jgi:hypothetical protein
MTLEEHEFAGTKHEPNIPNNGVEKILNWIMRDNALYVMHITK